MLEIDGHDGGGQIVRSALALSVLDERPIRLTRIRGARPNPGLRHQHLAGVRAAAQVSGACVSGDSVGSEELTFRPGALRPGEYAVDIGTAGSVTLLFETLLPLAVALDEPLAVTATGGTDVKWSPPMAFYRRVKLPLLRRFGVDATVDADRPGFYPGGGGRATLRLAPSSPSPIRLDGEERGDPTGVRLYSTASADLADRSVAERQCEAAAERLADAGLAVVERTTTYATADSTGSSLTVRTDYEDAVAGFDALGEPGKTAETVGVEAADAALAFRDGPGAVDAHLADQLLVFLALVGGRVVVPRPTAHVETCLDVLAAFGRELTTARDADGALAVSGE